MFVNKCTVSDMFTNINKSSPATKAVRELRIKAFINNKSNTAIASEVNQSRQTVARKLKSTDMKLSDFFSFSEAAGTDPVEILVHAFNKKEDMK